MKKYFLRLLFLVSYSVFSQNTTEDAKVFNYVQLTQKEWKYFEIKDSFVGEIIVHAKCVKTNRKSLSECMSMSIVKTQNGDTIRVLNLSNYKEYSIGQKIKVIPSKKPDRKTHVPFLYEVDPTTKKPKPMLKYDRTILNTTWGKIE
ncbi:hypothetical protein WFZ85_14420 [Flavobacterium sp. j3]|uniref:Uncharacterized protein n=1 Tax=Flavobacterium aureirubrum TaxID=3133147 RepID=A0ABU9N7Z4_9FLAO